MSVQHRAELPRPITRSSVLLYACAAVFVLDAVAGISAVRHTGAALDAFRRTAGAGPGELLLVAAADIRASLRYNLAVTVAALVVVAALGFAIRRPFPTARPCVWVAASVVAVTQLLGVADGPENGISLTGLEPVAIQDAMRGPPRRVVPRTARCPGRARDRGRDRGLSANKGGHRGRLLPSAGRGRLPGELGRPSPRGERLTTRWTEVAVRRSGRRACD